MDCVYSSLLDKMEWSEHSHNNSIIQEETKKLDLIRGEALCSVTEGWILASRLNFSSFALSYLTTFIIQQTKHYCGYVYYKYWTEQNGGSKPLVKRRGR